MPNLREFLLPEEYQRRMQPPDLNSMFPDPGGPTIRDLLFQRGGQLAQQEFERRISKAPVPQKEPTLMDWFLNGLIEQTSQRGEVPPAQLFQQRYRQSVSPAREFLANVFYGASAGASGERYRSLKERRWAQFQEEQKLILEEKAREQERRLQLMNILGQMLRAKQENDTQMAIAGLRASTQEQANKIAAIRAHVDLERLGMDAEKMRHELELRQFAAGDSGNPIIDFARRIVMARLRNEGVDLTTPAGQNRWAIETKAEWEKLLKTENELNPRARIFMPRSHMVLGPDGNNYTVITDPFTGQVVGGAYVGRNVSEGMLESANMLRRASDSVRTALSISQNNPGSTGQWEQMIPVSVRAKLRTLTSPERQVRLFFNKAVSDYVLSISGKAVTNAERQFILQGLPEIYEKPESFYPSAYAFAVLLDSAALRTQYGIDMDMSKAMQMYLNAMTEHIKKYKTIQGFQFLTAEQFLEKAAEINGKKLRRGLWGQLEVVDAQ